MTIQAFEELSNSFKLIKDYFIDEGDLNLTQLYISNFSGWLDDGDYKLYIEGASEEAVKEINDRRLKFFVSFFETSVIFDNQLNCFCHINTKEEFIKKCKESLSDSEDFLIYDTELKLAINTSYDFTDICYFSDESDISILKNRAITCGLHTFLD